MRYTCSFTVACIYTCTVIPQQVHYARYSLLSTHCVLFILKTRQKHQAYNVNHSVAPLYTRICTFVWTHEYFLTDPRKSQTFLWIENSMEAIKDERSVIAHLPVISSGMCILRFRASFNVLSGCNLRECKLTPSNHVIDAAQEVAHCSPQSQLHKSFIRLDWSRLVVVTRRSASRRLASPT